MEESITTLKEQMASVISSVQQHTDVLSSTTETLKFTSTTYDALQSSIASQKQVLDELLLKMGRLEKRHVEPTGNPPLITGMPLFSSPTLPPPITPIPTGPYSAGGVSIGPSTPFSPQYTHSTPPNIGQPNLPYFQSPPPYTSPLFTNPSNIQPRLPKLEVPMFSGDNVREAKCQLN
ncbi:hypothetical protein Tco_0592366 [Tanacetum coccineum]